MTYTSRNGILILNRNISGHFLEESYRGPQVSNVRKGMIEEWFFTTGL
jgi:hypothetical protein